MYTRNRITLPEGMSYCKYDKTICSPWNGMPMLTVTNEVDHFIRGLNSGKFAMQEASFDGMRWFYQLVVV